MNELALAAYLSLFAADGATTHQAFALAGPRVTVHEVFMVQNPTVNDALLAGQATALWWATSKVKRPVLRWSLRFGVGFVHGYAALHNAREIQKARR